MNENGGNAQSLQSVDLEHRAQIMVSVVAAMRVGLLLAVRHADYNRHESYFANKPTIKDIACNTNGLPSNRTGG